MAKSARPRRPKKRLTKEDFEFVVGLYQKAFKKAEPGLNEKQTHAVVPGKPWERLAALEAAYFLMDAALECFTDDPQRALDYYNIARGIGMAHGVIPEEDVLIPEPTVLHVTKKPS